MSTLLRFAVLLACCLALAYAQEGVTTRSAQPSASAKRLALVIGNDAYEKVSPLEKAGNDAAAMARELQAAGFDVLQHRNLNYRGMVKAVETLSNRITGGDQVVVFFAGHGVQIKSGSYLLPVDIEASSEGEVEKTAYGLGDLTDKLSEAKASFVLVIVDACRDNPLRSRGRSVGGARGLSPIEPPKGQMVVYSASRGQQALDRLNANDNNPNGVFTREFISRMRRPGVRIEDTVREVQDAVEELAAKVSHEQRPALYNESRGNFYFFAPAAAQASASPPAPVSIPARARTPAEIEDGFWDQIKDDRDSSGFEAYLKQYPNGRYAGQARLTLSRLKAEPEREKSALTERRSTAENQRPVNERGTMETPPAETLAWKRALRTYSATGSRAAIDVYLERHPGKIDELRVAARSGKADAQAELAYLSVSGWGLAKDYPEALLWARKAAERGSPHGQYVLGELYRNGYGVVPNAGEAAAWLLKAAETGLPPAQYSLGALYESGQGVDRNLIEATQWYRKAASQGDERARLALLRLRQKPGVLSPDLRPRNLALPR